VQVVKRAGHADVGDGLVDDLFNSTALTPTFATAAAAMTRNSASPPAARIAASCTITCVCRSNVSSNRAASAYTSSKAKLSKYSISSGSVRARVDTRSPNSWSWLRFAAAVIATD
jgi:hypothetical protein